MAPRSHVYIVLAQTRLTENKICITGDKAPCRGTRSSHELVHCDIYFCLLLARAEPARGQRLRIRKRTGLGWKRLAIKKWTEKSLIWVFDTVTCGHLGTKCSVHNCPDIVDSSGQRPWTYVDSMWKLGWATLDISCQTPPLDICGQMHHDRGLVI